MWHLSAQEGHRSISVVTTYTLCYFLVEQAQALVQWDLVALPDPEVVPPPGILIPLLRDPGLLLEG